MAQIDIKVNSVRSSNSRLKGITSDLTDTQSRISSLRHTIDSQITSRQGIGVNLNSMASSIHDIEKRLNQLHSFVDTSLSSYEQADKQVNANSQKLTEPPKKSFWESVGDFFGVVGNSIKGFGTGLWDVVVSTVEGIWNIITHPVETFKGLVNVIQHPIETAKGIWDAIKTSWNEDVINGDAESRGNWFGRAFGEIALAVVGTKGVDKAVKLAKGTKVVDEVGGVRVVDDVGSNKKDTLDSNKGITENNGKNVSRIEYLRNKYGQFTPDELNYRINLRGESMNELQKLKDSGISKKKMGPAFAGVYDKTTGKYYFSVNDFDGVLPDFHPIIQSRYDSMPIEVRDSYEFTKGAGSHAEVIALNDALKANPNASLDNFIVNVIRTGQSRVKPAGLMFPRCPHCAYLTDGFEFITEVPKNEK
ncbi:YwqJ-related putative deaminase [Bacillus timonensis]|uniref:YwqJ-related putative deaminase n=1 Tax=Bacillus timonensis TaxID=1033734 RepID=UPI000289858D|nr:YwqJ-related putative deaminase [Bacillus timonensis]